MSASRPTTRTQPRGINVRAFIANVEKGVKPTPDFFNADSTKPGAATKAVKKTIPGYKPPVLGKKPSLKQGTRSTQAVVIVSSCCRRTPAAKPSDAVAPEEEEEIVSGEVNCPSEDSGHSTCDLKYSGSISSNQSSSLDPTYQTLSELDDGYSERTSSSYGTTGSSAANEVPQYSDPSVVDTSTAELPPIHTDKALPGAGTAKAHQAAYKYHVPNKLTGTLPRDKKKAAFIGKAVAKGRTTLKKKVSAQTKVAEDNSSNNTTIKGSTLQSSNDSLNHSDFEDSDFDDSDFSDSEWETDGEDSNPDNHTDNHTGTEATKSTNRLSSRAGNNNDSDNSDYDTCIPDILARAPTGDPKSKSKFYTHDYEDAQQLVTLMRDRSTRKEKQVLLKRRLNHIKGNIQKTVQSSNTKLAAVKTFLTGKLKKPAAPKPDYRTNISRTDISIEHIDSDMRGIAHTSASSLSIEDPHSSDSQSDGHSISSHNSHKLSNDSSSIVATKPSVTPRHRPHSTSYLLNTPPLPPRNTRSQDLSETFDLGLLPAPPPPPRTTSRGLSAPDDDSESVASSSAYLESYERQLSEANTSSYSPKYTKVKPQCSPRLSRAVDGDKQSSVSKLSMRADVKSVDSTPSIPKTHSVPILHHSSSSPEEGATSLPHLPVRKESSKSLVISSTEDESVKRRNEILNNAAKSAVEKQNSLKMSTPPINEELPSPGILNVKVPPSGGSSPRITESRRVSSQYLIEDEPLYQEYHECILTNVKDKVVSKTSTLMRGGQPSLSLWSTTTDVLNSGVLDHMSTEEIKLQEAMFEVVTSEASYLRSIMMLTSAFVDSPQFCNEEILPGRDKKALFSNITAVLDVSTRLFKELEDHWKSSVILTAVCEIISKYAHSEFDVYVKYCSNQAFQDRTLKKLSQNVKFQEALTPLERSSDCHGLTMSSFLLLPMQRITRLPLLLDAILRRQEQWSDQYNNGQKCYELVKKVVSRCNEGARKMEQTEQVISIETKLAFNKLKKIPLTTQSRQLVKKGELVFMSLDGGKSAVNLLTVKPKTLSLFLFNDLLLITKKKGETFSVIDYTSRVNVNTEEWATDHASGSRINTMAQKSQAKFMFMLVLLENHQKKHCEFLLSCHTETERTRWIEAFTPQVQDDCEDKIYETWDCPQVQVTHSYVAQQPDELNLETGDILNVVRKTPDGWYEGERVSDGRTGWLPSSYTIELQNEHVRARHLKERYKLLQAAARFTK